MSAEPPADDPPDVVAEAIRKDPRYPRAAYAFVSEALHLTIARRGRAGHVSAAELLEGVRDLARDQFGPLARMVLAEWNVTATEDFGNVVFNLVEAGAMGKTEEDDISDFVRVYSFDDVFPEDAGEVSMRHPADEDDAEDDVG